MRSFYFEKDSLRYVISWNGGATFNVYLLSLRVPKTEIDVFTVYDIDNIEMAYEEAERWSDIITSQMKGIHRMRSFGSFSNQVIKGCVGSMRQSLAH